MTSYLRGLLPSSCLVLLVGCGGGGGGSAPTPSPPPPPDTTAPDTTLTATPPALANSSNATFTASTEAGAALQASLDGAAYATVTATFTLSNVADGAHTLNVRARDAAGNLDATPATYSWTVDTQAPDTTIAGSPAAHTNATSASFTFASEAGVTFQASLDGAAYTAATSPYTSGTLPDGLHTFDVRAVDAAGNADTTPASFAWTVDATGPTVQILFPTAVSYSDATEIHVRGAVNDLHGVTSVTVNGVAATGGIGFGHWNALVPISAGNNTIAVSATDGVGNVGTASAIVANRGPVQYAVYRVAWDGARNRALLTGIPDDTLFAARESDGHLSAVSGPSRGTGPALTSTRALVMDAPNNRVLAIDAVDVIEVDLDSGNRTLIPTAAPTTDTTPAGQMVCNSPCTRLYGYTMYSPSGPSAAFSIDLATGARTVISGMFGSGPVIVDGQGIVLDGVDGHAAPADPGYVSPRDTRREHRDRGSHLHVACTGRQRPNVDQARRRDARRGQQSVARDRPGHEP